MSPPSQTGPKSSSDASQPEAKPEGHVEYPSNQKRIVIMAAVFLAIFLITLDQNIISTAIPRITDDFHSLDDIGWYGSAYLLTMCSFQLLMGKVYQFYPAKPVFICGIALFEVGSAICGSAPSSKAFIVGRAIAGTGASGLFSGAMVVMFHTVPLQQRPMYQGCGGVIFAVASVVGPLLGGTLTDKASWRFCFYINLPLGAVAVIVIFFIVHLPKEELDKQASGAVARLKQLDPMGNLVFFPGVVCLILALQWGGTKYSWSNARIIALLVLCGLLCLAFISIQIWKKESATVPPRLVKQRSIAAAMCFSFFNGSSIMVLFYYLPIWFQAIKGVNAEKSGIMLLPNILGTVIGSLSSGFLVSKFGYYAPFLILSSVMITTGASLLTTFTPSTGHAKWISYQVLFGVGAGFGMQQPMNVVHTMLERSDIATGAALMMFMRFIGSAVFLPVAENVFLNRLISKVANLPDINAQAVLDGGATEIRQLSSGDDLIKLLSDYNLALVDVFYMVVATCALTFIGSLLVEWRSLKARAAEQGNETVKVEEHGKTEESV